VNERLYIDRRTAFLARARRNRFRADPQIALQDTILVARRKSCSTQKIEAGHCDAASPSVCQDDLTSIFFAGFWASAVFGSVIVNTPFEKSASILLRSTLPGSSNVRWNEP
jgi:hypothetical protein